MADPSTGGLEKVTLISSICVYCGSSPGRSPAYAEAARLFGAEIAKNGLRLTYGGGAKGIMGAVAQGVRENGGRVLGIIPHFLTGKEAVERRPSPRTEVIVTKDMHERKHLLFENADGFVAFPGGIGTVEEIVEIMTWAQLGRHRKPMVFANILGFWDPMLAMLAHMRAEGFIHTGHLVKPLVIADVLEIIPAILAAVKAGAGGDAEIIGKL
jgi:uncharacterized protein (TIGR00730 family)